MCRSGSKASLFADRWQNWFEGLQITQEPGGTSLLTGPLPDQPALFGVLDKLHRLNLRLTSLTVEEQAEEDA